MLNALCPVLSTQGLERAQWIDAFEAIRQALEGVKGNEIRAVAGKLADAEAIIALKVLARRHFANLLS